MQLITSAPKLLKMVLTGEHMSYCPHRNKGKGTDCPCFLHAVQKWQDNRITRTIVRSRRLKVHSDQIVCGSKNVVVKSNDPKEINCGHCIRIMNNPPKRRRARNAVQVPQTLN